MIATAPQDLAAAHALAIEELLGQMADPAATRAERRLAACALLRLKPAAPPALPSDGSAAAPAATPASLADAHQRGTLDPLAPSAPVSRSAGAPSMIRNSLAAIAAAAGISAAVQAQNFNIDLNAATGIGAGVPSLLYAAAGTAGVWNSIPTSGTGPFVLNNFAGNPSNASLARSGNSGSFQFNAPTTSGEFELLMDDVESINGVDTTTLTISGLLPGTYTVTTYAIAPDSAAFRTNVELVGAGTQVVGGALADNTFALGTTHAQHSRTIGAGQNLVINASVNSGFGTLNGLQLAYTAPPRIYVNAASTAVNPTGASWAQAVPDLNTALAMAHASAATSEIWIARGVYKPSLTDRNATFLITRSNLAIYGGFTGSEATLAARPTPLNVLNPADAFATPHPYTSLSGDIGPDSSLFDDIKHPVTVQGVASSLILDGLRFTRGFVEGELSAANNTGGGLTLLNASPTVRNCYFHVCKGQLGGAIGFVGASSATFNNCRVEFSGLNRAGWRGGAVYTADPSSVISFTNCNFYHNFASGSGSFHIAGGAVNLINCQVSYSSCGSENAGTLFATGNSTVNIVNCTIADGFSNIANNDSLYAGLTFSSATANIRNSIIWGMDNPASDGTSLQDAQVKNLAPATTTIAINYCTVEGWTGSLGGIGNNAVNPRFVAPLFSSGLFADPDYRLRGGSPMIDSGRNLYYTAAMPTTDLAGGGRFRNDLNVPDTGLGTAPLIDRGAFEAPGNSCLADVGGLGGTRITDGLLTADDVVVFLNAFFANDLGVCDIAQLGGSPGSDGMLTADDLVLFLAVFFAGCP